MATNAPVETNRREERRKAGFLASLLSKLGLGGGAAGGGAAVGTIGGYGAASGGLGALWGALLATKAGILALVLGATTVAAGVGYLVSGPAAISNLSASAGFQSIRSLFPGRPREQAAGARPADSKGGASDSIQQFVDANKGQIPNPDAAASGEGAAGAGAEASAGASSPNNENSPANISSPKLGNQFKPSSGFGSGSGGSGASTLASASGINAGGSGANPTLASAKLGASSGFGKTSAARSTARTSFGRRAGSRSATGQAIATQGAVNANLGSGNVSSAGSGVTYDGGSVSGGMIGAGAGISGGGVGAGGAGLSEVNPANPSASFKEMQAPPPAKGKDATPWKGLVFIAMGAMMAAIMLLRMAQKAKTAGNFPSAKMLAMFATIAAMIATMMGIMMMTVYGQKLQGLIFTAAGGVLAFMAIRVLFSSKDPGEAADKAAQPASTAVQQELGKPLSIGGQPQSLGVTRASMGLGPIVSNLTTNSPPLPDPIVLPEDGDTGLPGTGRPEN